MNVRLLAIIGIACLLLAGSTSALTVSVGEASGPQGGSVQVPISLEGASGVGSMDLVLTYDPNVAQAIGAESGGLGKNAYLESNSAKPGEVKIALADSAGINGNGPVVLVTFLVNGVAGSSSPLTVASVKVHTQELTEIPAVTKNGILRVTEGSAPTKSGSVLSLATLGMAGLLATLLLVRRRG